MIDQRSIAVLPFNNISAEPENQYFADGISEEIINALSKVQGLKVTSRTSSFTYRDADLDVRRIGNELGVSTILEGSVRMAGNRVRIATQLVRTDTGFQIWSDSFDRELADIFSLQDEISRLIAERIRENFGHLVIDDQLVSVYTSNTEAYNKYLQGRFYQLQWSEEGLKKALQAYKASSAADPEYPMPYLGMAQCFIYLSAWSMSDRMRSLYMAHHFLSKLNEEHDHIPEYHYTRGIFHLFGKWQFARADHYLLKALSINANYSDALHARAAVYTATAQFDEAYNYVDKALALNPNSPNYHYTKATIYYLNKEYKRAEALLDKSLAIEDNWTIALCLKAVCLLLQQKEADFFQCVSLLREEDRDRYVYLGELWFKKTDTHSVALADGSDAALPLATWLLILEGKQAQAMQSLKEAVEVHGGQYVNFYTDPLLEPLRQEPQYKLLVKMVFPEKLQSPQIAEHKEHSPAKLSEEECQAYELALTQKMEDEQVFLDQELSLRSLAEQIDLHPNKLSWLLNEQIGKSFNEYVNTYRLRSFQQIAPQPSYSHYTILGLAYKCGFNSKSVFNDFFRKKTGQTPSAWLKQHR